MGVLREGVIEYIMSWEDVGLADPFVAAYHHAIVDFSTLQVIQGMTHATFSFMLWE